MPIDILMPSLSPTMETGTLAKWLVDVGDSVEAGQIIAEIETDKATMEVEAVDEGVVGAIHIAAGTENVAVNSPIATLLEEGEIAGDISSGAPSDAPSGAPSGSSNKSTDAKSANNDMAAGEDVAVPEIISASRAPGNNENARQQSQSSSDRTQDTRVFASPLAKRLAKEKSIDINIIAGSGPRGRIIEADVLAANQGGAVMQSSDRASSPEQPQAVKSRSPSASATATGSQLAIKHDPGKPPTEIPHTTMRRVIAARLTQSKQQVPHFYLSRVCQLDRLLRLRSEINSANAPEHGKQWKISVNDMIIKALGAALMAVPGANVIWQDDALIQYHTANITIAVAVPGGLYTPLIKNVESKRLSEVSSEMKYLAGKAKNKSLTPEEYTGGTTSLSNLGMFKVSNFSAIINPPQSSILAVGAAEKQVVALENGEFSTASKLALTLSCDHRAIDGVIGAQMLDAIVNSLEAPYQMLV